MADPRMATDERIAEIRGRIRDSHRLWSAGWVEALVNRIDAERAAREQAAARVLALEELIEAFCGGETLPTKAPRYANLLERQRDAERDASAAREQAERLLREEREHANRVDAALGDAIGDLESLIAHVGEEAADRVLDAKASAVVEMYDRVHQAHAARRGGEKGGG